MKVQDVMITNVESIGPTSSLRHASRKMSQLGIGTLPVAENGQLLGIITDRDISCFAVAMGRDPNSTEIQKVMVSDLTTCYEDQDLEQAAHLMEEHHIRRILVLHHDNTLAGLLSVDDLARASHDLAGAVLEAATPIH